MERTRKPWNKTCETAGSTLGVAGIYLSTVLLQVFLYYTYKDKYTRTHCELITLFGACNVDISLRSKCFSTALNIQFFSTLSGFNAAFNRISLSHQCNTKEWRGWRLEGKLPGRQECTVCIYSIAIPWLLHSKSHIPNWANLLEGDQQKILQQAGLDRTEFARQHRRFSGAWRSG